jgi:hypothetical protein
MKRETLVDDMNDGLIRISLWILQPIMVFALGFSAYRHAHNPLVIAALAVYAIVSLGIWKLPRFGRERLFYGWNAVALIAAFLFLR